MQIKNLPTEKNGAHFVCLHCGVACHCAGRVSYNKQESHATKPNCALQYVRNTIQDNIFSNAHLVRDGDAVLFKTNISGFVYDKAFMDKESYRVLILKTLSNWIFGLNEQESTI